MVRTMTNKRLLPERALLLLAVALLCLTFPALAADKALVIGVGEYENEGFGNLPGVRLDVASMVKAFRIFGVEKDDITVLMNEKATLDAIRGAFHRLASEAGSEDRVYVYFTGHGVPVDDEPNGDEGDGSDEAILPYDAAWVNEERLRNVLVDDEIGQLLDALRANEIFVFTDTCFSGTSTRSPVSAITPVAKSLEYPGMPRSEDNSLIDRPVFRSARSATEERVVLLSAAGAEEEALQLPFGPSIFTSGVIKAIERAQAKKKLTLKELQNETRTFVESTVARYRGKVFKPEIYGSPTLSQANLFIDRSTPKEPEPNAETTVARTERVPPQTPRTSQAATPAPTLSEDDDVPQGNPWRQLLYAVDRAEKSLTVHSDRRTYGEGEPLELSIEIPTDGYLYVLNVGRGDGEVTVLFPNDFDPENFVQQAEQVEIPRDHRFQLPARLPQGASSQENLIVVFLASQPVELGTAAASPLAFQRLGDGDLNRSIRHLKTATRFAGQHVVEIVEGSNSR